MPMDYQSAQSTPSPGYPSSTRSTAGLAYETKGPADPSVESPSVIRDGVCYTEQTLSELHTAIDTLEKRLETALKPVPPQADSNRTPQPSGPPVSHLAGRLVILNEGYQQAVFRLRELARRVEV
jgi:hypothetical protein